MNTYSIKAEYLWILVLTLIVISGYFLRTLGNNQVYDPDEWEVVESTYKMKRSGTFDPRFYNHPNHFSIYANALVSELYSRIVYGKPYVLTFNQHKGIYYRLTRFLVALLGTLTIVIAYLVGNEFNRNIGLISAFLFSFFGSYVAHSHYARPDVPLVFFVVLTLWLLIRFEKTEEQKFLLLASVTSAFATTTKYSAVLLTLLIALSVVQIAWKKHDSRLFLKYGCYTFFTYAVSLFVVGPYLFINYENTAHSLFLAARSNHLGADGLRYFEKLFYYADAYYTQTDFLLLIIAAIGLMYGVRKYRQLCAPLLVGFIFWVALSALGLHWERWALPMYVSPLFFSAFGIYACFRNLYQRPEKQKILIKLLLYGCLVVGLVPLVSSSVSRAMLFTLQDTRDVALAYMKGKDINKENSVYEGYTPFIKSNLKTSFVELKLIPEEKRYVVLSSYVYSRYLHEPERYKNELRWYRTVFDYHLVKEFVSQCGYAENDRYAGTYERPIPKLLAFMLGPPECYKGPTIRIYQIPDRIF